MAGMENLPTEMSLDILKRLPTTSLLCFKCVCKAWFKLASHPDLKDLYKRPCILVCTKDFPNQLQLIEGNYFQSEDNQNVSVRPFKFPSLSRNHRFHSLLSCNGLLLVSYLIDSFSLCYPQVTVYNPLIDKLMNLPEPKTPPYGTTIKYAYGFGFDKGKKKYKVVRNVYADGKQNFYVVSLGKSYWKHVDSGSFRIEPGKEGVHCKGFLYWRGYAHGFQKLVVSFNLGDEKFSSILFPDNCTSNKVNLVVLEGSLSLFENWSGTMCIWSLKGLDCLKKYWTKTMTVKYSGLIDSVEPLFFLRDGKIFLSKYPKYQTTEVQFGSYDPTTESHKHFRWVNLRNNLLLTSFDASLVWPFT